MKLPVVQVCGGVVRCAVGVSCIVLNREAPIPMGGGGKYFDMGERFFDRRPLFSLPKISRKNARVENELVCIVNHFLGGVGHGDGVHIRDCVIDILLDDLDGFYGVVCLATKFAIDSTV